MKTWKLYAVIPETWLNSPSFHHEARQLKCIRSHVSKQVATRASSLANATHPPTPTPTHILARPALTKRLLSKKSRVGLTTTVSSTVRLSTKRCSWSRNTVYWFNPSVAPTRLRWENFPNSPTHATQASVGANVGREESDEPPGSDAEPLIVHELIPNYLWGRFCSENGFVFWRHP